MPDMPHSYTFHAEKDPFGVDSIFGEVRGLGETQRNPIVLDV